MTLQQLRCFCEVVNQRLNISRAARALHTTQPAITRMIRKLEAEFDVPLLVRLGPRIVALTDEGHRVVSYARMILRNVRDLRVAAIDARDAKRGSLNIATTSLQARYALLDSVYRFATKYPDVSIEVSQGTPAQIVQWVAAGDVDLGVSPLPAVLPQNIFRLFAYPITRCIVTPCQHPLLKYKRPSLAQVAMFPLIAYSNQLEIGAAVRDALDKAKLSPRIAVHTSDVDLVKSYVRLGLGIGVIQEMAFDPERDTGLRKIYAGHLFAASTAWVTIRRDQYLRRFMYDFIEMVAPKLTRAHIDRVRLATPSASSSS